MSGEEREPAATLPGGEDLRKAADAGVADVGLAVRQIAPSEGRERAVVAVGTRAPHVLQNLHRHGEVRAVRLELVRYEVFGGHADANLERFRNRPGRHDEVESRLLQRHYAASRPDRLLTRPAVQ